MIGDAMYEVPGSRLREMSDRITELTARAERAEAAEADLRATVERVWATWRYIADTMATSSRDWSETATDAWLYGAIVGWGDGPDDPDEAWTAMAAVWWDADDVAQLKEIHATLAALDAQRPAEGGPEVTERLIEPAATPCPHCGPGYRYGDEGCRHEPAKVKVIDEVKITDTAWIDGVLEVRGRVVRSHEESPAALDGGQPDTRICGWCANGDCVNCDWDEHEPPERCAHICYPPREEPTHADGP